MPEGSHFNLVWVKQGTEGLQYKELGFVCVWLISFSIVWFLLIRDCFNGMGFNNFTVYETTVLPLAVIYISRQRKAFCQLPTASASVAAVRKHCSKKQIMCCYYWKTWKNSKVKTAFFKPAPLLLRIVYEHKSACLKWQVSLYSKYFGILQRQ